MKPFASFAFIALFAFLALPATAFADAPDLAGTYQYDEQSSDNMEEAFKPAVDAMSRLKRGFTRRRIANQPPAPQTVRIEQSGDSIAIHAGDSPVIRAPLNGEVVDYVNADDETEKVTARVDGQAILVHRDFEDGEYHTRYYLQNDGQRLIIASKINMDALPKVVDYSRTYNRR